MSHETYVLLANPIWIVIMVAIIVIGRQQYQLRMHRMGINLIAEAREHKEGFPDSYPAYHDRAVAALENHGVGHLIQFLPPP